jgi:hypothetical protein
MSRPWSKLKSRVEDLWVPKLGLQIHCTSYDWPDFGSRHHLSRHWITLGKAIIWDFPAPFLRDPPARGRRAEGYLGFPNGGRVIGELLRDYVDRDRDDLFDPFEDDGWELTDILRAADRRLGRAVLKTWAKTLDDGHPAHAVLAARFGASWSPGAGLVAPPLPSGA